MLVTHCTVIKNEFGVNLRGLYQMHAAFEIFYIKYKDCNELLDKQILYTLIFLCKYTYQYKGGRDEMLYNITLFQ